MQRVHGEISNCKKGDSIMICREMRDCINCISVLIERLTDDLDDCKPYEIQLMQQIISEIKTLENERRELFKTQKNNGWL